MSILIDITNFVFDTLSDLVSLVSAHWVLQLAIFLPLVGRVADVIKRRFL